MQFHVTFFLLLLCQISLGQTICDSQSSAMKIGDYPPGCFVQNCMEGNNMGYTPDDTISYDFICGDIENSRWYTFFSGATEMVEISIPITNCKNGEGLEMSVFDEDLNSISNCIKLKSGNSILLRYTVNANKNYHILIDGINGDECDFEVLIVYDPLHIDPDFTQFPILNDYCIGAEICFEIEAIEPEELYFWTLPASDSIMNGGGINDSIVCIHFKTGGNKKISVDVEVPCGISYVSLSKSIFVKDRENISLDTIYTDKPLYCREDTMEFYVDWENQGDLGLYWKAETSVRSVGGGGSMDTFYRAVLFRSDTFDLVVRPIDECGVPYIQEIPVVPNLRTDLFPSVCEGFCFQIGDSCYYETVPNTINTGLSNSNGCDSTVSLVLTIADILPSPLVKCKPVTDGLLVEWEKASGADSYKIFIDRDSFTTITDNFILLENISINSRVNLKIQPFGACTYLPAEITCLNGISYTDNHVSKNEIKVYPNPTPSNLNIETELEIEEIEVFDTSGRFLQKENTTSFDLKSRTPGIYFLKIKTSEGVVIKRILKN